MTVKVIFKFHSFLCIKSRVLESSMPTKKPEELQYNVFNSTNRKTSQVNALWKIKYQKLYTEITMKFS